ncbi:endonuclease/exonuclease/phosphatase family protein [Lutibacter sp. B1]|uniref:endonuclease/exonuclease/phosphatase family protein n=1 Tax=Lutibacter sp. B1 TaxID=2725996 RepID=UPI001456CE54|nr:endonuclease/exonuclease/phosphatase family protein [Lutibacter sp. B1]NLP57310.1 endonuclease [Lutibacter sp. B1]
MFSFFKEEGKVNHAYTIAFYNLENLFDTKDDPLTLDDDFTPEGKKHWNYKRYKKKIKRLGSVIAQLGAEKSFHTPAIVGVVEVENRNVVNDLVHSKHLEKHHYDFVHYDSPDERGIDVALLYKKELFELLSSETFTLYLESENGDRDFTRDILLVKGNLNGELVHVIINHWPSRRDGSDITEEKRIKAAKLVLEIVGKINAETENAKIIVMGDFNDDPTSNSVKEYLVNDTFYNPMERLINTGKGTLSHRKTWHLFDQIIFSKNFLTIEPNKHSFKYAEVFDKEFLKVWKGKLKGSPYRTYIGKWYKGGFSDHFPVYVYLSKN